MLLNISWRRLKLYKLKNAVCSLTESSPVKSNRICPTETHKGRSICLEQNSAIPLSQYLSKAESSGVKHLSEPKLIQLDSVSVRSVMLIHFYQRMWLPTLLCYWNTTINFRAQSTSNIYISYKPYILIYKPNIKNPLGRYKNNNF
jgi:hypothetical protein